MQLAPGKEKSDGRMKGRKEMRIGKHEFDVKEHTYLMGILNVTPDSFSDGGKFQQIDQALFHAQEMIAEGAHILDIGGESTRPGYIQISEAEEIERVVPVIERIKENFDIPVSLDTYKSAVAKAGIEAGADLINDIWGLLYEESMAEVIARSECACCLMHNRKETRYQDFFEELKQDLAKSVMLAKNAGIREDKILLDPGVGFAKTYEQNLETIRRIGELKDMGYPILLGTSRKSVIGLTLDVGVEKRLAGTLATSVYGILHSCAFLRVHDIKENLEILKMTEAILYGKR